MLSHSGRGISGRPGSAGTRLLTRRLDSGELGDGSARRDPVLGRFTGSGDGLRAAGGGAGRAAWTNRPGRAGGTA